MENNTSLKLFESQQIRTAWDADAEKWYFSVVDVVAVLTDQPDARHASNYWAVLNRKIFNELLTNCKQLEMITPERKTKKQI